MSISLQKSKTSTISEFDRLPLLPPICSLADLAGIEKSDICHNQLVFLTFDDGPDSVYTPKVLDVLSDYDVKASFFVLGEAAERFPHLLEKMMEAGHAIGNHTYSHRHPWVMSSRCAKYEVTQASSVIKDITGIAPRWFRPPFGRLRTSMHRQAHIEKMATVLWSRSSIDWGVLGTKAGISKRIERVESGDIVLMHDGKREHNHPDVTIQCLPKFLRSLTEKTLVASSLDEVF